MLVKLPLKPGIFTSTALADWKVVAKKNIVVIFKAYEDIPEHILNDITKECGDSYLNYITTKKKENATLAVAIGKNGAVAGLSWLTLAKKHYKNSVQQYLIIHSCLTFPLYRGHGYYPKMILALCKTIFNDPNNTFDKVYMECSWANTASVKGILKCGFRDAGILISFRDKVLFEQMTF